MTITHRDLWCCRTRPVIQVKASLLLPDHIDRQVALCRDYKTPTVCFNVTICFTVRSRQFRGSIGTEDANSQVYRMNFQSCDM